MLKLRNELISLFTVDSVRRIATECLVPMITQVCADPFAKIDGTRVDWYDGLDRSAGCYNKKKSYNTPPLMSYLSV